MENLDGHDVGLLGNAVNATGNSTGAVSTMSVDISKRRVGIGVVSVESATLEVCVDCVHTSVDDIRPHASSGRLIVGVHAPVAGSVRDGTETPGGVLLHGLLV